MVKTVVREHHWTPDCVDNLFFDDEDLFGLIYWFNDCREMHREIEKK